MSDSLFAALAAADNRRSHSTAAFRATNRRGAGAEEARRRSFLPALAVAAVVLALVLFFALLPTPEEAGGGAAPQASPANDASSTGSAPVESLPAESLPSGTFAITGVQVFDGERVLPRADVLVRDGRISAVGEGIDLPAGVPRVDGDGRTLLPGLVDGHVHAYGEALEQALRFGVTTVLDMFTDPSWARTVREAQAADGNPGAADLFSAGYLATAPGGHGTQFGMPVPPVTADTDPDAWVAARKAEGSDYVKIVLEDGHTLGLELPTLSGEQVAGLAAAAQEHGLLAVAHVGSAAEARTAVEAGVDGLVHLAVDEPLDAATVRLAAEGGVFVVPTLTVLESIAGSGGAGDAAEGALAGGAALAEDPRIAPRLAPDQVTGLRRRFPLHSHDGSLDHALESVRRLAAAGVAILAGSDAPNPGTTQGASLHRELELLVRAGLSPAAALAAATAVPATAFGLDDRGRILPGRRADLVLVEGDPTRDVTATRDLLAVWKAGVPAELAPPVAASAGPVATAASRATAGPISSFDDGAQPTARLGMGLWVPSTDERMGGRSTVELAVEDGALQVSGELVQAFAYPWSGALLFPAAEPMQPADLSAATGVAFRARGGDGTTTMRLYLFSTELGPVPAVHELTVSPQWQWHRVPFSVLGVDGSQVSGLMLAAGSRPGPFELWFDDVELYAAEGDPEAEAEPAVD